MAGANGRRSSVAGSRRSSMAGENSDSNKSQFDDIPIIWIIGKILDSKFKSDFNFKFFIDFLLKINL